jgi:membrane protein implicated in regulation of membrane protease activity
MFSKVANFLLFIGTLAVLSAIGVIGSLWGVRPARNLFIASILVIIATEFLTPRFFFPLIQKIQVNLGLNVGLWIRLSASALSSILAFFGLWRLYHSRY